MSLFKILTEDHQKVTKLLAAGETNSCPIKARKELLAQIKSEIEALTKMEEMLLYPSLEQFDETKSLVSDAYKAHQLILKLLDKITALSPDDENWTARFATLKKNIEAYIKKEEGKLFPQAKRVLNHRQMEEIELKMQSFKSTF